LADKPEVNGWFRELLGELLGVPLGELLRRRVDEKR